MRTTEAHADNEHGSWHFGSFEFQPVRRLLLDQGKRVRIGHRALDLLRLLVGRAGEVVTKDDLIAFAWPTTIVEEANLRVHIRALRRALRDGQGGNRYIVNVAGRGYQFVADVSPGESQPAPQAAAEVPEQPDLPAPLTRMIGRAADIQAVHDLTRSSRLVTIVGPGGVGKSILALEVASALSTTFRDGARFVDLAAISNPSLLPNSLAMAIGLVIPSNDPVNSLVAFLKKRALLLVLDNCEHLVDRAAGICEAILKGAATVAILATSREPLRVQGERQHRLSPLGVPAFGEPMTAASARQFAAVELFVERATTNARSFELTDANARFVSDICRRLDGIPLAIELAAARVGLLGARDLIARLDDQLFRASFGRRTGSIRHQTLGAALDWSYSLLSGEEQMVLRRLSVFSAAFTLESAVAVAAHRGLGAQEVVDAVLSLSEKSLLTTHTRSDFVLYRLLRTTQSYAHEKLATTDDYVDVFRWHAEHMLKLLRQGEVDWNNMTRAEWVEAYDHAIDDLRSALEWAFATHGDPALAADLTVAAVPFAFQMKLTEEIRERLSWVLRRLEDLPARQPAQEAVINQALNALNMNMERDSSDASAVGLYDDAARRGELVKFRMGPVLQRSIFLIEDGDYRGSLEAASELLGLARLEGDPLALLVADRVMSQAQHFLGNHVAARILAERVIAHPAKSVPLTYVAVQVDRRVSMRIVMARASWMTGQPDRALQICAECLRYAVADTPFAVCQTLALASCPLAFWRGDAADAARLVGMLLEQADRNRLGHWRSFGECYALIRETDLADATSVRATLDEVMRVSLGKRLLRDTLTTVDPRLMMLALDAQTEAEPVPEGWCAPELLRVRARRMLEVSGDEPAVELLLRKSLEIAGSQGASAWRLRTATDLAALCGRRGRREEGRGLLLSSLALIEGGGNTRDVLEARRTLANL